MLPTRPSLIQLLTGRLRTVHSAVLLLPAVLCHSAIANEPIYLPAEVVAPAAQFPTASNMPSVAPTVDSYNVVPVQTLPTAIDNQYTPINRQPMVRPPVMTRQVTQGGVAGVVESQPPMVAPGPNASGYVRLGAPLYPSPSPNVPIWTGGSMITNQAFAPHEMLYPHKYKALYPPFYHKVSGHWLLTPLGVKSHERWELQGTMVEVNYSSHYPILPKFVRPHTSMNHGPWK